MQKLEINLLCDAIESEVICVQFFETGIFITT